MFRVFLNTQGAGMYHIVFDTVRKKHPKGDPTTPSNRI